MNEERQNQFLLALRQITIEVGSKNSLQDALALLVTRIRQSTGADCCSLYLCEDLRRRYRLVATDGLAQTAVGKALLSYGEGLVGVVGRKREILNLADAPSHPNFKYLPDIGEDEFQSFLGAPVLNQGELLGVLVIQSRDRRQFGDLEESFLVTISSQISSILAQSRELNEATSGQLKRYRGTSSTGDLAIAQAMVWQPPVELEEVRLLKSDDPELQHELFLQTIFQLQLDMDRTTLRLQEGDKSNAAFGFMSGYGRILDDEELKAEIESCILDRGYLATSAIKTVVEQRLGRARAEGNSEYAVDLKDFAEVLISNLVQTSTRGIEAQDPVILVMENMPAAMVGQLPEGKIAGFVTTTAGTSAHATILARDLGIPSVLGVPLDLSEIDGHTLIIDGKNSEVLIDPPDSVVGEFKELLSQTREQQDLFSAGRYDAAVTADGQRITVQLNAGLNQKSSDRLADETDGIGLYRTEIAFMLCQSFPTEQQQYEWYANLLEQFPDRPVCMRTLDIGSDKGLSYMPIQESNPALGWRGVRVTIDQPQILMTQLRAMLRAHQKYGNLEIMVPMVSSVDEVVAVKQAMQQAARELAVQLKVDVSLPRFGIMLEVPSVIYLLDDIAPLVDFFSIGSNDLIQYMLAVDRANPRVSRFFDAFHPAVVRALAYLSRRCGELNRRLSLCGELAATPLGALLLLSLGYTNLSMNYSDLARIKYIIRHCSSTELQAIGIKAVKLSDSHAIRQLYIDYANGNGLGSIIKLAASSLHDLEVKLDQD